MPRLRNIEKVANALGCEFETFSDKSASWVNFEDKNFVVNINFDGNGNKFTGITIAQKIYQVVDEKVIAEIIKP